MEVLVYLVPMALALGLLGLAAFLWSLKSGQFDDLEGAAYRALEDDDATPIAAVECPTPPGAAAALKCDGTLGGQHTPAPFNVSGPPFRSAMSCSSAPAPRR
jgi:cbb3-type cytochrome oxidase maturation protein